MENEKRINPQEILYAFMQERDAMAELRDEMNHWMGDLTIKWVQQRYDFYRTIAIFSGTIMGATSIFDQFYWWPTALYVGLIAFILLNIRERIDKDSIGLQRSQDKYN